MCSYNLVTYITIFNDYIYFYLLFLLYCFIPKFNAIIIVLNNEQIYAKKRTNIYANILYEDYFSTSGRLANTSCAVDTYC